MLRLQSNEQCNGCHACYNACPAGAIAMQPDGEGFLYPSIDETTCIRCKRCVQVCPLQTPPSRNPLEETYVCRAKDDQEYMDSSSGGAFSVLARKVLEVGGVVFGAAFDENQQVVHRAALSTAELSALKETKYVQSAIGDVYAQVDSHLKQGRQVLFSGTPCQVAGLRTFLGWDHENLLTMDLICHGVPSPGIWAQYLQELSEGEPLTRVSFRNKTQGIHQVTLDYTTASGRLIQEHYADSPYIKAFAQNLSVRPSCFSCPFKGSKRCSDITIGDFWSATKYHPEAVSPFGVSALLIHSEKGQAWLDRCREDLLLTLSTPERAALWNESMVEPAKASPNRALFFEHCREMAVAKAVEKTWIAPSSPLISPKSPWRRLCVKVKGRLRKWSV